jgi:uncharacterized membrane protein YfcA
MAGWFIGGLIGMVLTASLARRIGARWAEPILFFSPALFGLFLGAFAGYCFARRRAEKRG